MGICIQEYGRAFVVDLPQGEIKTAEDWFKNELERHPAPADGTYHAPEPDEKYRVFCRGGCGPVVIGYGRYRDQLARANSPWVCPVCGSDATFDDEQYETYLREKDVSRETMGKKYGKG